MRILANHIALYKRLIKKTFKGLHQSSIHSLIGRRAMI